MKTDIITSTTTEKILPHHGKLLNVFNKGANVLPIVDLANLSTLLRLQPSVSTDNPSIGASLAPAAARGNGLNPK